MNNYIVLIDKLLQDNFNGKSLNRTYLEMCNKIQSSNAIIWNAFAPWKYGDPNNSSLIIKILETSLGVNKSEIENDFKNNTYIFFGQKAYFRNTEPDLVIDDGTNCLVLESKYTEDSTKAKKDKCEQIGSYLTDIFYKLISNGDFNPYLIVLYSEKTGKYYEYFQLIQSSQNDIRKIRSLIEACLEKRSEKSSYRPFCDDCAKKLNTVEGANLLGKISQNVGLLSWERFKELLFEYLNINLNVKTMIDNYDNYEDFFKKRTDRDFLLESYARARSNLKNCDICNQ